MLKDIFCSLSWLTITIRREMPPRTMSIKRPLQSSRKIVLKGPINALLRRFDQIYFVTGSGKIKLK